MLLQVKSEGDRKDESTTGLQHTSAFTQGGAVLWNVLEDIQSDDEVELLVSESQACEVFIPNASLIRSSKGHGLSEEFTPDCSGVVRPHPLR
jgi:hypothetical protein